MTKHPLAEAVKDTRSALYGIAQGFTQICRFVNDVLHIRESEKHLFRRAPVERTHREIVVFTLVNG